MILHFQNARLIDPEALTDEPGSLTVQDGLIVSVDDDAPEGARIVDCAGRCLAHPPPGGADARARGP